MTVEWFDLAQRLAAAASGKPVARLAHAPVARSADVVAVRAAQRGERTVVTACRSGQAPVTAEGADGVRLLGDLGVLVSGDRHTLLTDDAGTLPVLRQLAQRTREPGRVADTCAHVGWWAERADFPGTSAVLDLLAACRTRWVTGTAPGAERHAATWRTWLGVADESVAGLFDLYERVSDGLLLPGLAEVAEDDEFTWGLAVQSHADGWDWRRPDSISRAATGLRSRCDTADLYAAALLDDPLHRRRAVHTGHVVHGTAAPHGSGKSRSRMRLVCDRLDARLRAGSQIVGWTPTSPIRFSGSVTGTGVENGRLVLDLLVTATTRPGDGQPVTLIPAPPDPNQTRNGRSRYRALYSTRTSWLTTGRTPVPQRREVPLDVLFAGATDDQ